MSNFPAIRQVVTLLDDMRPPTTQKGKSRSAPGTLEVRMGFIPYTDPKGVISGRPINTNAAGEATMPHSVKVTAGQVMSGTFTLNVEANGDSPATSAFTGSGSLTVPVAGGPPVTITYGTKSGTSFGGCTGGGGAVTAAGLVVQGIGVPLQCILAPGTALVVFGPTSNYGVPWPVQFGPPTTQNVTPPGYTYPGSAVICLSQPPYLFILGNMPGA
jgi:hypothetical protein